jgi:5-hydroxyisourate hydrolase
MSKITTHVLDAVLGKPAAGIPVKLETKDANTWIDIAAGATDKDGRCRDLAPEVAAGVYRLTFEVEAYFTNNGRKSIYPAVTLTFQCDGLDHYHLPLLLSDNSYTTYRGS